MARERVVAQLPSTAGIEDEQVRAYLDQLTNAWALRNGDTGDGNHRFITRAEFNALTKDAIVETFSGSSAGAGGTPVGRPPSSIDEVIDSLAQSVFRSQLFRDLGKQISRITAPWDVIDELGRVVSNSMSGITLVKNGITHLQRVSASTITTVDAINLRVGTAESQIVQINTVSATSTSANALALFALTARVSTNEASITSLNTLSVDSSSATARAIYQMRASMGNLVRSYFQTTAPAGTAHTVGDQWFDTDDGERAYYWNGSAWTVGSFPVARFSDAGILAESSTRVTRDTALAAAINHIWSTVGGATAAIVDGSFTNVNAAQTAFATRYSTIQSAVYDFATNTNKVAAVDQRMTTTIDLVNNKFNAAYTLRVEVGPSGRTTVGGFGVMGFYDNVFGASIDFAVRADRFFITSTSAAAADVAPFIVQTTTGSWGPPGVYITQAMISDALITTAKIERQIRSLNYVSGSTGWSINSLTGDAEFNNVTIRGTSRIGRLNLEGAIENFVDIANNTSATVTHGEGRKVVLTTWTDGGIVTLHSMTDNAFTLGVGVNVGPTTRVYYRYF